MTSKTEKEIHKGTQEAAWIERFEIPAGEPEAVTALRRKAIERFEATGFPTLRDEEWRQTNVAPVTKSRWNADDLEAPPSRAEIDALRYAGCRHVVFVDGRYVAELSDEAPAGVTITSMAAALSGKGATHVAAELERLGRYTRLDHNGFLDLNSAFFRDGVVLRVDPRAIVEEPIHLLFLARGGAGGERANFPRNLIVAGSASQVTLVETYVGLDQSDGATPYFSCPVTEIFGEDGSVVDHYRVQKESLSAAHIALQQVWLDRAADFSSHTITHGGGLVRTDNGAVLDAEGIECTLNGLYVVSGSQVVDNHMRVEHVKPHCNSHELYKGILDGRARAVFSGRIYVHPGAQKTDAKQTNRNLILSPDAISNSNPQLEIFADDVRCTHGSTTGHIDDEALFYLRSRGIGVEAARSLLTYAFASEVVDRVKLGVLQTDLKEFLFERLPGGEVVRQAIREGAL